MKKKMLPMLQTRAELSSVNEQNRTVEVVFSTGAKGLRSEWDTGPYYEELSMDPKHVDMSRLNSGTSPVLSNHNRADLSGVIGVVERAWLDGNQGKAVLRFSASDPAADQAFKKIQERVLRNVSVGYSVQRYEDVSKKGDAVPTMRATAWQPQEISIVPIGFDAAATTRNEQTMTEVEISTPQESDTDMTTKNNQTEIEQARAEERERVQSITSAVRAAKLDASVSDDLVTRGVSADQARQEIMTKLASQQPAPIQSTIRVDVTRDEGDHKRAAFIDSVVARIEASYKPHESARMFQGMTMVRAIELLQGRKLGESDHDLVTRAMSTSDMANLLANVAEKGTQQRYQLAPRTYEKFCRTDVLRNFKQASRIRVGNSPSLLKKPEGAEYQVSSFGEEKEVVQLSEYGVIYALSSQMLVNDDLGVLQVLASEAGTSASRLENKLCYAALTSNPVMGDSLSLFHASHGNLSATGTAITEAALTEGLKALRKMTGPDGTEFLNIQPRFLICGPDKEIEARKQVAAIAPTASSSVNVFSTLGLEIVVDAQITGNQWYLAADQALIPTVTLYKLEGHDSPTVTSRIKFSTDNLELKVNHSVAAAPSDWRGLFKNAGN